MSELTNKWYVTYGNQYIIAGPYNERIDAQQWLSQQKRDYPDPSNDWDNHVIQQISAQELLEWDMEA